MFVSDFPQPCTRTSVKFTAVICSKNIKRVMPVAAVAMVTMVALQTQQQASLSSPQVSTAYRKEKKLIEFKCKEITDR